jgi:hypothetical protein
MASAVFAQPPTTLDLERAPQFSEVLMTSRLMVDQPSDAAKSARLTHFPIQSGRNSLGLFNQAGAGFVMNSLS